MELKYNPKADRIGPGVYNLADLRERCSIPVVRGCWIWRGGTTVKTKPRGGGLRNPIKIPPGVLAPHAIDTTTRRAAVWLSGRDIPAGKVVWTTCGEWSCCNPAHLVIGGRGEQPEDQLARMNKNRAATRRAISMANCWKQAIGVDLIQEVERRLHGGMKQVDACREFGISKRTMSKIANGQHYHQRVGAIGGDGRYSRNPFAGLFTQLGQRTLNT